MQKNHNDHEKSKGDSINDILVNDNKEKDNKLGNNSNGYQYGNNKIKNFVGKEFFDSNKNSILKNNFISYEEKIEKDDSKKINCNKKNDNFETRYEEYNYINSKEDEFDSNLVLNNINKFTTIYYNNSNNVFSSLESTDHQTNVHNNQMVNKQFIPHHNNILNMNLEKNEKDNNDNFLQNKANVQNTSNNYNGFSENQEEINEYDLLYYEQNEKHDIEELKIQNSYPNKRLNDSTTRINQLDKNDNKNYNNLYLNGPQILKSQKKNERKDDHVIEKEGEPHSQYIPTNNSLRRAAYLKDGQPDKDEMEIYYSNNHSNKKICKEKNYKIDQINKESDIEDNSLLRSLEEKWENIEQNKKMKMMQYKIIEKSNSNNYLIEEQHTPNKKISKSLVNRNAQDSNDNANVRKNSEEIQEDLYDNHKKSIKNFMLDKSDMIENCRYKNMKNNNFNNFKSLRKSKLLNKDLFNYDESSDININLSNKKKTNQTNFIFDYNDYQKKQTHNTINKLKNSSSGNFFNSNSGLNFYDNNKRIVRNIKKEADDDLENFIKQKTQILNQIKNKNLKNMKNGHLSRENLTDMSHDNGENKPVRDNISSILAVGSKQPETINNNLKLNSKKLIEKIFKDENITNEKYNTEASSNSNTDKIITQNLKEKLRKNGSITIYEPNLLKKIFSDHNKNKDQKLTFLKPMNNTEDAHNQLKEGLIIKPNNNHILFEDNQEAHNLAHIDNNFNSNSSARNFENNYLEGDIKNNLLVRQRAIVDDKKQYEIKNKILNQNKENNNSNFNNFAYNNEQQTFNNKYQSKNLNNSKRQNNFSENETHIIDAKAQNKIEANVNKINNNMINNKNRPSINNNSFNLNEKLTSLYSDIYKINRNTNLNYLVNNESGQEIDKEKINRMNYDDDNNININYYQSHFNHRLEMNTFSQNEQTQNFDREYPTIKSANKLKHLGNVIYNKNDLSLSNLQKNFENIFVKTTPTIKNTNFSFLGLTTTNINRINLNLANDGNQNSFLNYGSHSSPSNKIHSQLKNFNSYYIDFMGSLHLNSTKNNHFSDKIDSINLEKRASNSINIKSLNCPCSHNKILNKISENKDLIDMIFDNRKGSLSKHSDLTSVNYSLSDVYRPNLVLNNSKSNPKCSRLLNSGKNIYNNKNLNDSNLSLGNNFSSHLNDLSTLQIDSSLSQMRYSGYFTRINNSKFY